MNWNCDKHNASGFNPSGTCVFCELAVLNKKIAFQQKMFGKPMAGMTIPPKKETMSKSGYIESLFEKYNVPKDADMSWAGDLDHPCPDCDWPMHQLAVDWSCANCEGRLPKGDRDTTGDTNPMWPEWDKMMYVWKTHKEWVYSSTDKSVGWQGGTLDELHVRAWKATGGQGSNYSEPPTPHDAWAVLVSSIELIRDGRWEPEDWNNIVRNWRLVCG